MDDQRPLLRQPFPDFQLGLGDSLPAAQKLQVSIADIGNHPDSGAAEPGEESDFPPVFIPISTTAASRHPGEQQQGKGQSDVVVQIPLRSYVPDTGKTRCLRSAPWSSFFRCFR